MRFIPIALIGLLTTFLTATATASIVVGGSALLSQADADQLESWLGEGPITITKVYEKLSGDDSLDFHAAVNGKGRTFSVLQVLANSAIDQITGLTNNPTQIIGGYNPQGWYTSDAFFYTPLDADRTAFLFNLTTGEIQRQSLSTEADDAGSYQTYHSENTGPVFGFGSDIYVASDLTYGITYNRSYGGTAHANDILSGDSHFHEGSNMFGAIEVFEITAASDVAAVPEPLSVIVWGGLAVGVAAVVAYRRGLPATDGAHNR